MRAIDRFGCNVRYMSESYCILEFVGETEKTETILSYLKPLGIAEIARTGIIALPKNTE